VKQKGKPSFELRPLTGIALKSIRDTLRPYFPETDILELFAGTGLFSLVALESGARQVTLVEASKPTFLKLQKPFSKWSGQNTLLCKDVFKFLSEASHPTYDIIFLDPPFDYWTHEMETFLSQNIPSWLKSSDSILLVKHPKKVLPFSSSELFMVWKSTAFGDHILTYFLFRN
jgi:16S rRNA G966 N2-methylase RsmD